MLQHYGWILIVGPVAVMVALWFIRPKSQPVAVRSLLNAPAVVSPDTRGQILDLGGMALVEVLHRLDEAITKLDTTTQTDLKSVPPPELIEAIVVMCRSALMAFVQSVQWRQAMSLELDPVVCKSLGENLLDGLKLLPIGSPNWVQLWNELVSFHDFVVARAKQDDPGVVLAQGGSTPPS